MKPRLSYLIAGLALVLFVISSAFAWKYYNEARFWQETFETETQQAWDLYNQAKVRLVEKIERVEFLDKRLQEELGKTKIKTVKEVVKVYVETESEETSGRITETSQPDVFRYDDFRLHAIVDVPRRTLSYTLTQRWGVGLYVLPNNDYRVEIAELDPNGNVLQTYSPTTFTVTLLRPEPKQSWNLGINLNLGAAFYLNVDPSPLLYLNFVSYGETHLDSSWRVASLGVSQHGLEVVPVSYRISDHLPFLSDLFLDLLVGTDWRFDTYRVGLGLSSTF